MPDGSRSMGGPVPEKTVGWLWGFGFGAGLTSLGWLVVWLLRYWW